jgi:hypothetical protein
MTYVDEYGNVYGKYRRRRRVMYVCMSCRVRPQGLTVTFSVNVDAA